MKCLQGGRRRFVMKTKKESDRKKVYCPWSNTYWAWGEWNEKLGVYSCTCQPCKPPKKIRKPFPRKGE